MGIYVNPNYAYFEEVINDDIYVDKTMMIKNIADFIGKPKKKFVCVSRPRRFGKTIASAMLSAFFSKGCDSQEMFSQFKISKIENYKEFAEKHLNKHNVILIDVNSMFNIKPKEMTVVEFIAEKIKKELSKEFEMTFDKETSFPDALVEVFQQTGQKFILMMDEYDVMIRDPDAASEFPAFLKMLNGLFKSSAVSQAIELAYLTGILPIIRDRVESKLNNFREFTMLNADELAEFIGFTESEVKDLCETYDIDFETCKRWYDGYKIRGLEIYNPNAITSVMLDKRFGNHWTKTGSFEAVSDYISLNFEGIKDDVLKMLVGEKVSVDSLTFRNTKTDFKCKDDVFTYLIHLGYLAYDSDNQKCYIPNYEIKSEWEVAIKIAQGYSELAKIIKNSEELLKATQNADAESVAKYLDDAHTNISNNLNYNNEGTLQSAILLAYLFAKSSYSILPELTTGKGYADVVFLPYFPNIPAIIVELKVDENPSVALNQIKSKQYFKSLEKYTGDLLLVGIDYNKTSKKHSCKIEKFNKD